jgi:sialic acid synthase SpsE
MKTRLILDFGSNHGNSIERVKEIITLCKEVNAELKFQIFKNKPPNIALDMKIWDEAVRICEGEGVKMFASVWDIYGINILAESGCQTVKFAYSMNDAAMLIEYAQQTVNLETIVSTDIMGPTYQGCKHLYCIPLYPVQYEILFDGLFPRFDGFSDHSIGISQSMYAVMQDAAIIEKHVTTEANDVDCPDAKFAIKPSQVRKLRSVADDITAGQ